jgi:hypothetical protein
MMRANSAEGQPLLEYLTMAPEFTRAEDAIVGMVTLDGHTDFGSLLLHTHLASDCVAGGGRTLVVNEETAAGMVGKDGATRKTMPGGAITRRANSATQDGRNVVIHTTTIPRSHVPLLEDHLTDWADVLPTNARRAAMRLRIFTSGTKKIGTGRLRDIVGARENGAIPEVH